jgi:hypothetical protein
MKGIQTHVILFFVRSNYQMLIRGFCFASVVCISLGLIFVKYSWVNGISPFFLHVQKPYSCISVTLQLFSYECTVITIKESVTIRFCQKTRFVFLSCCQVHHSDRFT